VCARSLLPSLGVSAGLAGLALPYSSAASQVRLPRHGGGGGEAAVGVASRHSDLASGLSW